MTEHTITENGAAVYETEPGLSEDGTLETSEAPVLLEDIEDSPTYTVTVEQNSSTRARPHATSVKTLKDRSVADRIYRPAQ